MNSPMVKNTMRLSWWLGGLRRNGPIFLIIFTVVFLCFKIYIHYHEVTPVRKYHEYNPITEEDIAILAAEEPKAPILSNWWVLVWDSQLTCNEIAAALSSRWSILIASNNKIPKYSHSRCVYFNLTELTAKAEEVKSTLFIEMYMKAIKHDAEAIYVASKSTTVNDLSLLERQLPDLEMQKLFFSRTDPSINLSIRDHFGCTISTAEKFLSYKYEFCAIEYPEIISPLISYDRLTSEPIICDKNSPMVVAQTQTYVEMQLFGSLFFKEAFWALPLSPKFDNFMQWHLVIQRILWLYSGNVAIFHGQEKLIGHLFSSSFDINLEFFHDLDSLNCTGFSSVDHCLTASLQSLSKWLVLPIEEQRLLNKWLLLIQNYMPLEQKTPPKCLSKDVQYRPAYRHERRDIVSENLEISYSLLQRSCTDYLQRSSMDFLENSIKKSWKQFDGILLVIVFNNAHYEAIPYLETLYRSFFPNLLYCGPDTPQPQATKFSFISYGGTPPGHSNGSMNYECLILAYSMYPYMSGGYFVIADDILLLIHKIVELPVEQTWFIPKSEVRIGEIQRNRECKLNMCDFYTHWPWWLDYQNATITALLNLREQAKKTQLFHRCYRKLIQSNGALLRANGGYSDIYYVPRRQIANFVRLAQFFLRHNIFLEIAIPTIVQCLEMDDNIAGLHGIQSWDADYRDTPWHYFRRTELVGKSYFHPTKWGFAAKDSKNHTLFFCKTLEYMYDKYGRISA